MGLNFLKQCSESSFFENEIICNTALFTQTTKVR